jgi:hypothetical protein
MRALLLRRTAFLAVLGTGLGLTAAGISGLSGMDTSLKLAAATQEPRTAPVSERWDGDCDRGYGPQPVRHRI